MDRELIITFLNANRLSVDILRDYLESTKRIEYLNILIQVLNTNPTLFEKALINLREYYIRKYNVLVLNTNTQIIYY